MDEIELKVNKRETLGKKVRFLRREGITPLHLFGHGIESLPLQCDTASILQILTKTGQSGLINLKIEKERKQHPAVVREIQVEPKTRELLHVDFYQVQMAELLKVEVPITLTGEAPALKIKENMMVQDLNNLSIECLPSNIPSKIEIDVNNLTETDQAIRVRDIVIGDDISILNNPDLMVVKISTRRIEVIEEPVAVEEVEVEGEAEGEETVAETAEAGKEAKEE